MGNTFDENVGMCAAYNRLEAAKERGVKFGRPATQYDEEFLDVVRRFKSGEIILKQVLALTD